MQTSLNTSEEIPSKTASFNNKNEATIKTGSKAAIPSFSTSTTQLAPTLAKSAQQVKDTIKDKSKKQEEIDKELLAEKEAISKMIIKNKSKLNKLTLDFCQYFDKDTNFFYSILSTCTDDFLISRMGETNSIDFYKDNIPWRTLTSMKGLSFSGNRMGIGWTDKVLFCGAPPNGEFWPLILNKDNQINFIFDFYNNGSGYGYPSIKSKELCALDYPSLKVQTIRNPLNSMWTEEDGQASLEILYEEEREDIREKCFEYQVSSTKQTSKPTTVYRYYFSQWNDASFISVEDLDMLVKDAKKALALGGLYIHCGAGRGRAGTFVTAVILEELISKKTIKQETFREDLIRLAVALRLHRSPLLIQTSHQLTLLENYGQFLLNQQSKS